MKLFKKFYFSTKQIPIINIEKHLNSPLSFDNKKESENLIDSLINYGVALIKDPRVDKNLNDNFLNLMERYFEKRGPEFYKNNTIPDMFPETGFQTGVTPENFEKARNHFERITNLKFENKSFSVQPPIKDPKWRYAWAIGDPKCFESKIAPKQHIPSDFPEFEISMNNWGNKMVDTVLSVSEMLSLNLFNDKNILANRMKKGPHLLAPTGSDLNKYNKLNTVLAGYHYDLSYITIHGKSRYPGLYIWLKDGTKMPVKIPDGCLLIQAAKMLEIISGGVIYAGFHEVIVDQAAINKIEESKLKNKSLWRVSSTLFSSIDYDDYLEPLPVFKKFKNYNDNYKKISVDEHVRNELKAIELFSKN